jgi:hypothetical protein
MGGGQKFEAHGVDVLALAEWDRATRSALEAGGTIRVLDFPSLDLTQPEGRGFLALFSAMAKRERMRMVKRTQEGRRLAIEAGKRMGRKPKLTAHQQRSACTRVANGESTPGRRQGFRCPSCDHSDEHVEPRKPIAVRLHARPFFRARPIFRWKRRTLGQCRMISS